MISCKEEKKRMKSKVLLSPPLEPNLPKSKAQEQPQMPQYQPQPININLKLITQKCSCILNWYV